MTSKFQHISAPSLFVENLAAAYVPTARLLALPLAGRIVIRRPITSSSTLHRGLFDA